MCLNVPNPSFKRARLECFTLILAGEFVREFLNRLKRLGHTVEGSAEFADEVLHRSKRKRREVEFASNFVSLDFASSQPLMSVNHSSALEVFFFY
jgi:hypothetical protein